MGGNWKHQGGGQGLASQKWQRCWACQKGATGGCGYTGNLAHMQFCGKCGRPKPAGGWSSRDFPPMEPTVRTGGVAWNRAQQAKRQQQQGPDAAPKTQSTAQAIKLLKEIGLETLVPVVQAKLEQQSQERILELPRPQQVDKLKSILASKQNVLQGKEKHEASLKEQLQKLQADILQAQDATAAAKEACEAAHRALAAKVATLGQDPDAGGPQQPSPLTHPLLPSLPEVVKGDSNWGEKVQAFNKAMDIVANLSNEAKAHERKLKEDAKVKAEEQQAGKDEDDMDLEEASAAEAELEAELRKMQVPVPECKVQKRAYLNQLITALGKRVRTGSPAQGPPAGQAERAVPAGDRASQREPLDLPQALPAAHQGRGGVRAGAQALALAVGGGQGLAQQGGLEGHPRSGSRGTPVAASVGVGSLPGAPLACMCLGRARLRYGPPEFSLPRWRPQALKPSSATQRTLSLDVGLKDDSLDSIASLGQHLSQQRHQAVVAADFNLEPEAIQGSDIAWGWMGLH